MTTFVIDAGVAIKRVIDEPGSAEALLLRRHRLIAPDLIIADCANILWKKVRRKEMLEEGAAEIDAGRRSDCRRRSGGEV